MNVLRTVLVFAAVGGAASALAIPSPPDPATLAERLVTRSAGVHENDIVLVEGGVKDQALLERIAANVSKVGGYPLITFGSDSLNRLTYDLTPVKYDQRTPVLGLKLADMCNAMIAIDYNEDPGLFSDVPPERAAVRANAVMAVHNAMLKKGVRMVQLGNGLYPTVATARRFGITQDQLADIFWSGVNTDPALLQSTGEKVTQSLLNAKDVTITNPNGTNLTFKINGRTPYVSDGIISADDVKKGGPACQVWLPAGEVYVACTPGTADGAVVFDRFFFRGDEIKDLRLTLRAGKITNMTAASGLDAFTAYYDAAGEGKDALAVFDIGINPEVRVSPNSKLLAWMPSGMVTLTFGNNTWAGGDNKSAFDFSGHLPNSTVKLDGRTLIDDGALRE